jgi:hypothetical protein
VTIGVAITYGQTRFRAAAEPSIVILATIAIVAGWDWTRRRLTSRTVKLHRG